MSAELNDIIATLERGDWGVWTKIAALDRATFLMKCCCNSEKCQRIKIIQLTGLGPWVVEEMGKPTPEQMPIEVEKILDACKTNPMLEKQMRAYNRSRFDLIFKCGGGALLDITVGDS